MPASEGPVSFETPHLAREVEKLSPEQIDVLPFGAIRLDHDGRITFYSAAERLFSGYRQEALDRLFFAEVAPCLDTEACRGRMENALRNGSLDIDFTDFVDLPGGQGDVELRVRMQSSADGGSWIFTHRLD